MLELQQQDRELLKSRGISEYELSEQLKLFTKGVPFIKLLKPCTKQSGIKSFDEHTLQEYITLFKKSLSKVKPIKFTPASGAASRMFALLSKIYNNYDEFINKNKSGSKDPDLTTFLEFIFHLKSFAFVSDLNTAITKSGLNLNDLLSAQQYRTILEFLLTERGLDYLNCPKGLIKFHRYEKNERTAFEEHIVEAINYSKANDGIARVHFTILRDHEEKFLQYAGQLSDIYSKEGTQVDISFSFQSPDTDIVAVDFDNVPLRDGDGNLIFRPGGHGALLKNLALLDAEIIFVKNIDNVIVDNLKDETVKYKEALGGILIDLKNQSNFYLSQIDDDKITDAELVEAFDFIKKGFEIEVPDAMLSESRETKKHYIFNTLNRPLRVCGVVKNEGEPGGGPFWIRDSNGLVTKQIVESAQVDMNNNVQKEIWNSSTHFNPVDLVCSIYDYKGNKFNLQEFVDMNTVFITKKSKDGIDLKAMELPGLWNGSMAGWNTLFVEVPLITFNPVKTVFDLLKPQHQAGQ